MKSKAHIYMANLIIDELNQKHCLTFKSSSNKSWPCLKEFKVSADVEKAILSCPSYFRAGAIGPDFFPDMLLGQMDIHPSYSGEWLTHMHSMLTMMMPSTDEYYQALAFYLGYSMHYACDMYGHDNINLYAGGWFPDFSKIALPFMSCNAMDVSEDSKKIIRHIMVESYLDDKVNCELSIDIPYEYLRMCYGSVEAVEFADKMRKKCSEQPMGHFDERGFVVDPLEKSSEDLQNSNGKLSIFKINFLESFVKKYDDELRNLCDGCSSAEKVEYREYFIINWIDTWYQFACEMLKNGTGAAIKYCLVPLLRFVLDCMDVLPEKDKKMHSQFIGDVKNIKDVFDKIEVPLIGDILDYLLDVTVKNQVKSLLYPYLNKIAVWLYSLVNQPVECKDYDDCIKKIKGFVSEKALFMNTRKGLFAEWNDKADHLYESDEKFRNFVNARRDKNQEMGYFTLYLDYIWGNFGKEGADSLNQDYKEFQACINMGKLCLLDVKDLNGIVTAIDSNEKRRFTAKEVVFSIRRIGFLLGVSSKSGAESKGCLCVGICRKNGGFEQTIPRRILKNGEEAVLSMTLEKVVPVEDITNFTFRMTESDNLLLDYMTVYDEDTGIILASVKGPCEIDLHKVLKLDMGAILSDAFYDELLEEYSFSPNKLGNVLAFLKYDGSEKGNKVTFIFERNDGSFVQCAKDVERKGEIILDLNDVNTVFAKLKSIRICCKKKIHISKLFMFDVAENSNDRSYCFARLLDVDLNANESCFVNRVKYDSHYRDRNYLKWNIKDISLVVKTSGKKYAGTDGDIYFEVYKADKSRIKKQLLDKTSYDDFESGDRDVYGISLDSPVAPRDISKFSIRLKESWWADDWICEYCFAFDSCTGQMIFNMNSERELTKSDASLNITGGHWLSYDESQPVWMNPFLNGEFVS